MYLYISHYIYIYYTFHTSGRIHDGFPVTFRNDHYRPYSSRPNFESTNILNFFNNENTTGSTRGCFFINYNSNIRCTTRDGFSPLFFILNLNDLPEGISSQVRLLADDCILYREINTLNDCQDLQKDINTLCNWESKWQMKFNIDKCYIMHVTHKRNDLLMTYNMNGRPIEATASHTYLGIGMNNKLSWAKHISNTVSKAKKVLGLLRRNLYSSPFVKETAYKSLVRPRLEYCSSIWDPYHQEYKNKLESVQRRAARFVCEDFRRQKPCIWHAKRLRLENTRRS